jgi:ATP-dependent DNA ligase
VQLSPATTELTVVRRWFANVGGGLDGIIAKELDEPYHSGERRGMVKVKQLRTVECVVGGFRYASKGNLVGSLLLGLYNDQGLLDHVGFCSSLTTEQKKELTPKLEKLIKKPGFTGQAPGGPSRWSTERSAQWQPLAPKLVVEVQYDHFTGGRFRHGTKFLRWRPDKAPSQCTTDQLEGAKASPLLLLKRR